MGQESEELKADIESRRERMSETVDAIGDRVSPSRIAQRRVERTRGWVGGVRDRVMGSVERSPLAHAASGSGSAQSGGGYALTDTVSEIPAVVGRQTQGNPLIAGVIAFGLGALIASLLPETESEQRAVEQVQPQLDAATDAVKESAQAAVASVKDSAQDAAVELKESATEKAQTVKDAATESAQQVKEATSNSDGTNA